MGKDFDDLDDDFFNMDDEVDEGEDGKRKPLKTKLKKTGKDFLDDFKHTPIVDQAKEVGEGFTNTVIGEDNIRAFEEAKKALEDSTKGLRKTSSALLENTAKKLGSDTVLGRVADKIANAIYTKDNIVLIIGVDGKPLLSITGNPFYVIRNGDKVPVNDESSTIPDIVTKQKENDSLRIAVLSML